MTRLVEEAALGVFETFHLGGHWDADGISIVSAIRGAVGDQVRVRRFPWGLVAAVSPFVPLFRELWELRDLWREPLRLDNARLVGVLGAEPHTPIEAAVRYTLAGLGCLGGPIGRAISERPSRPVLMRWYRPYLRT